MSKINGLEPEQLGKIVQAVKENPDLGRTVWRAHSYWREGFQVHSEIRGFHVQMDEPADLGGTNSAANPVEMVLASLGSCMCIGYAMNAAVLGIEIQKLDIELEGNIDLPGFVGLEPQPDQSPLPGFTEIHAKVYLKTMAPKGKVQELHQRVFSTSPVGTTLSKEVKIIPEYVQRRFV
ncbi:MAG: OsmC family protein [Thermaerobacter sp.]|nr:OsmC family protein [Thermaerobacter sp.]MDA8145080.1 OsmC family protein [Thermaerobacter sp.]